jgi:hypothetical protein
MELRREPPVRPQNTGITLAFAQDCRRIGPRSVYLLRSGSSLVLAFFVTAARREILLADSKPA